MRLTALIGPAIGKAMSHWLTVYLQLVCETSYWSCLATLPDSGCETRVMWCLVVDNMGVIMKHSFRL